MRLAAPILSNCRGTGPREAKRNEEFNSIGKKNINGSPDNHGGGGGGGLFNKV